jgi:hypothetical protein
MSIREAEGTAWTIAEAKTKLPEILRLAESEGPQRIGARKRYIVVPEDVWLKRSPPPEALDGGALADELPEPQAQMSISQYLLQMQPRGIYSHSPYMRGSSRPIPFAGWTEEDWAAFDATDPEDQ